MDATLLALLLGKAKVVLRITTTAFDDEITDIILAGYQNMITRGVIVETDDSGNLDPMVLRALMTYVRAMFGEPSDPERLHASYNEQLGQLMTTTGYTNWGDV